jgi:hypothetical protein
VPTLQFHPIADIFPLMSEGDLEELVEDIRRHGLREPVTLFEGRVLDGRNRASACQRAGVELLSREFAGTRLDAVAFVWSRNRMRRHLTSSQAALAEAKRLKLCEEYAAEFQKMKADAKAKKKAGKGADGSGGRGKKKNLGEGIPPGFSSETSREDRKTSTTRARVVGTNRKYLEAAERLLEQSPDLAEKVEAGKLNQKPWVAIVRLEKLPQLAVQLYLTLAQNQ